MDKKLMRGIYLGLAVGAVLLISYIYFFYQHSQDRSDKNLWPEDTLWLINKIDSVNGTTLSPEQLATVRSIFNGSAVVIVVRDDVNEKRIRRTVSLANNTLVVTQQSSATAEIGLTQEAVHELRPMIENALADHDISTGEKAEIIEEAGMLKLQGQINIEDAFMLKLIKDKTIDTLKSFVS